MLMTYNTLSRMMFHILLSVVNFMFLFDLNKCEILYVAKSANFTIKCPFKSENGTVLWGGPPNLNTYSDKETVSSKVKGIGIIGDSANGEYSLIVYGFDEPNEGLYQCSAVFDNKPIMYVFKVVLQTRQPTISMNISPSESIIEGTNVLIECKARNNPSPSVLELNGPDGNILNFTGNPDKEQMIRFTLSDIKRKDIGYYTCTARNSKANRNVSVLLNILYSPTVTITGRNFSNIEPVRNLECVALGNPNTYKYKQWEHSFYGQHIRFLSGLKNGTLVLPFINKREHRYEDSGSYKCFVGNGIPDGDFYQTADIFIQTKGRPVFLRRNRKSHYGKFGDSINIQFYIYSKPDVTSVMIILSTPETDHVNIKYETEKQHVTETFHNQHIQLLVDVVTFRIPKIDLENYFTNYTIEAKNENKNSRFTFQLKETTCYCPDVPYITTVLAGTNSVKIDWSGGYSGGFPQTYFIEYKQESHSKWVDNINITDTLKTSYTTVIDNLLPNKLYNLRMYAVNSINRSQFSNVFNVTTGDSDDYSRDMFSYSSVYITIGIGLMFTTMASVWYFWYKSVNFKRRHEHSEHRNSGQQEGNVAFNNIYGINENRQPTVPGAALASVVYSNFSRNEHVQSLRTDQLSCRPSTSHTKPPDQQLVKQKPSELNYIEIDLDPVPQDRQFHIHGNDNRTEYSEIEIGVIGDPLQFSESETDDDNDTIDCAATNT